MRSAHGLYQCVPTAFLVVGITLAIGGSWIFAAGDTIASPSVSTSTQDPAYTIPTLDLSTDKARQTIVDREPGQYLGHPTTVLLEDHHTMLIVYPKGHGRGSIVYKRSNDAGFDVV